MFENRQTAIKLDGDIANYQSLDNGVPQGNGISPPLYIIMIAELKQTIGNHNILGQILDDTKLQSNVSYKKISQTILNQKHTPDTKCP